MKKKKLPKGLSLNNPFNIKVGNDWQGESIIKDPVFESYVDMESGIRAGLINLYNAYFSKGLTLAAMVHKYAPEKDNNNEAAYVAFLSEKTGVLSNQVPFRFQWLLLASAIMRNEQGQDIMSAEELKPIAIKYNLLNYV
jgi:hypothetical protein